MWASPISISSIEATGVGVGPTIPVNVGRIRSQSATIVAARSATTTMLSTIRTRRVRFTRCFMRLPRQRPSIAAGAGGCFGVELPQRPAGDLDRRRQGRFDARREAEVEGDVRDLDTDERHRPVEPAHQPGEREQLADPAGPPTRAATAGDRDLVAAEDPDGSRRLAHVHAVDQQHGTRPLDRAHARRRPASRHRRCASQAASPRRRRPASRSSVSATRTPTPSSRRSVLPTPITTIGAVWPVTARSDPAAPRRRRATRRSPRASGTCSR